MTDSSGLHHVLENARRELLDLTTRNRLLHTPRNRTRSTRLEIVDEMSDEVYWRLAVQGKAMSFLARSSQQDENHKELDGGLLSQPDEVPAETARSTNDDDPLVPGPAARHRDDQLQTELVSEQLQKRLLQLFYDARTFEEEQGVNILYLAIGFLRWYEDDNSDRERFAPLLLVPVQLDRPNAHSRFKLRYSGDEITTNLSL